MLFFCAHFFGVGAYIYTMKLQVYADMPCGVFINGKQYTTPFTLETKTSECGQFAVLPASPEEYSGYTLTYTVEEDRLKSLSGGANGVSWGAGLGEIKLSPPISEKRFLPEIISQKKALNNQITLYTDGAPKIMCEGGAFFAHELPRLATNLSLRISSSNGVICAVEGVVKEKKYMLALTLTPENEWKIIHEITADVIETTDKGVYAKEVLATMLRHEKKTFFKPFDSKPVETSFVPTMLHEYKEELIPYLFFECVMIENADAENLLDSSLQINLDGLKEFFGEFDTIVSPPFGDYSIDVIAVYNSKERLAKPNLYKIETQNHKITNIIHLLTCY